METRGVLPVDVDDPRGVSAPTNAPTCCFVCSLELSPKIPPGSAAQENSQPQRKCQTRHVFSAVELVCPSFQFFLKTLLFLGAQTSTEAMVSWLGKSQTSPDSVMGIHKSTLPNRGDQICCREKPLENPHAAVEH